MIDCAIYAASIKMNCIAAQAIVDSSITTVAASEKSADVRVAKIVGAKSLICSRYE